MATAAFSFFVFDTGFLQRALGPAMEGSRRVSAPVACVGAFLGNGGVRFFSGLGANGVFVAGLVKFDVREGARAKGADHPNGTACDEASDCTSGYCGNGFCRCGRRLLRAAAATVRRRVRPTERVPRGHDLPKAHAAHRCRVFDGVLD
jgi:hypothetical protein